MKTNRVLTAVLVASLLTLTGCKKESDDSSSTATTVTEALIAKSWASNCVTAAVADPVTGSAYYSMSLTLNADNTFSYAQYWYTNSSCSGLTKVMYYVAGAYAIASINGSATTDGFGLAFFATSSSFMATDTTVQGQFNTACGGTSPYAGGVNSSYNGVAQNSYGTRTCMNMVFANSTDDTFYTVATFNNSALAIGDGSFSGLPGVPENSTPPAAAGISLH